MRLIVFTTLLFSFSSIYSQNEYYMEDYVYQENIKSVKLFLGNNPLEYPVSNLADNTTMSTPIHLEFDDIEGDDKNYYYKIIHCDMNWEESKEIEESDYIDGFNGEKINDSYSSSFTLLQYTHYSLTLPNENTKWLISGNYLLIVYDENEDVILTKRFLVAEKKVKVFAKIDHAKDVTLYKTAQDLEITLNTKDYRIVDPLKELKVTVLQNDKWIDAAINISPKYLLGYDIRFDAFSPFVFKALNEFRYFDTRSLYHTNLEIQSININRTGVEVVLEEDLIRKYSHYFFHKDLDGNFLYLNSDHNDGNITGQYTNVNFTLKTHAPIFDKEVYVIGGFCDWQLYDENKLEFDNELSAYTGKILIKQGVVDYYYAIVDKDENIDLESMEGSWFETENQYTILVYQRPFGGQYDKLVGYRVIE